MNGRTDGRMDGQTDGRMDGWADGRTDEWTDGQTDRPSCRDDASKNLNYYISRLD